MCPGQSFGDLERNVEGIFNRQRPPPDTTAQRRALDELHGNEHDAVRFADLVDGRDIGMRNRCGSTRLAQEPLAPFLIGDDVWGEDLQGNWTTKILIFGSVDHTHPTLADLGEDSEVGKGGPFHRLSDD